jgi:N-acetylmuramic acid 6-phosphate etherase
MKPITEHANPRTRNIDRCTTIEIIRLMNAEDLLVADAISRVLEPITAAVDVIAGRLEAGGCLFYVGAGTSGRLGVLDASECPPTFGVQPDLVRGIIAGGYDALRNAVEGAEDDPEQAARDLMAFDLTRSDVVAGLSANGNTPYTLGAVNYAKSIGAATIGVTCNPASRLAQAADIAITPEVGPEVIAGSSRLKAGTAQKMVLNMLSTAAMVKLGRVYGNLMSNLEPKSDKLRRRAIAILVEECDVDSEKAAAVFHETGEDLRVALLMLKGGTDRNAAEQLLEVHGGSVRRALDSLG